MNYPYVVLRIMAGVYQNLRVDFPADRQGLVAFTVSECKRIGQRMCCVFAADDCVYCEPDGSTRASAEPPSGGARLGPTALTKEV